MLVKEGCQLFAATSPGRAGRCRASAVTRVSGWNKAGCWRSIDVPSSLARICRVLASGSRASPAERSFSATTGPFR